MGELALSLDLCGGTDKEEISSPPFRPHHLQEAGELSPPLTFYSNWDSRPSTLPVQYSRVDPEGWVR